MQKINRTLVLISAAAIQLFVGIIYMWSVLKGPVMEYLGFTPENTLLVFSIMLGCFVVGIIGGGRAMDKLSPRGVILTGTLLFSAGMIISSFVTKEFANAFYFTYPVLCGIGTGICYTSCINIAGRHFPEKRGFATGVIVCAFGFSVVLFSPISKSLIANFGISNTYLYIGLVSLVVTTICALLIKNPESSGAEIQFTGIQLKPSEMLKTLNFYKIFLGMLFVTPAFFIINPLLMELSDLRASSLDFALILLMITGISSSAGRLISGWISDKIGRKQTVMLLCAIMAAACGMMIFATDYLFIISVILITFAYGGTSGVFPSLTADAFGAKNAGTNYGFVMVAFGVSAIISPNFANFMKNANGTTNFTTVFVVACALCLISLLSIALIKKEN